MIPHLLKTASEYGVWDILSLFIVLSGAIYVFFPIKKITNLVIHTEIKRNEWIPAYPLRLEIKMDNRSESNLFLSHAYFYITDQRILPHINALRNSADQGLVVNMPEIRPSGGLDYNKTEYLLRNGENIVIWIPLDPSMNDTLLEEMAQARQPMGEFRCECLQFGKMWRNRTLKFTVTANRRA